jgi:hypothetical protein
VDTIRKLQVKNAFTGMFEESGGIPVLMLLALFALFFLVDPENLQPGLADIRRANALCSRTGKIPPIT